MGAKINPNRKKAEKRHAKIDAEIWYFKKTAKSSKLATLIHFRVDLSCLRQYTRTGPQKREEPEVECFFGSCVGASRKRVLWKKMVFNINKKQAKEKWLKNGAKGKQKRAESTQKRTKRGQKEAKRDQNGAQKRPKCIQKSIFGKGREKGSQKRRPPSIFGPIFGPKIVKIAIFENIRVLWGSPERPKARFFWFFGFFFSTSILGSIFDGFLEEKGPKMMPKWMPKSLKFRCYFGTCDFLFFAKSIAFKSLFTWSGVPKTSQNQLKIEPKRG